MYLFFIFSPFSLPPLMFMSACNSSSSSSKQASNHSGSPPPPSHSPRSLRSLCGFAVRPETAEPCALLSRPLSPPAALWPWGAAARPVEVPAPAPPTHPSVHQLIRRSRTRNNVGERKGYLSSFYSMQSIYFSTNTETKEIGKGKTVLTG